MGCLTCCLGCITICGCRDQVVRRLAYAPPSRYSDDDQTESEQSKLSELVKPEPKEEARPNSGDTIPGQAGPLVPDTQLPLAPPPPKMRIKKSRALSERVVEGLHYTSFDLGYTKGCFRQSINGARIKALRNPGGICFIFSHGNAADVRTSLPALLALSEDLQVDVVVYDYPGYGKSTGSPTETGTYLAMRLVFEHVTETLGYQSNKIVLYGQSIGSGPAIDLACELVVGGVVLHCPIASGLRVVSNDMDAPGHWFDIYRNLEKIQNVKSPVFICHGTDDSIVPVEHGLALARKFQQANPKLIHPPWWVAGADHGDIECSYRKEYLKRLRAFLAKLN